MFKANYSISPEVLSAVSEIAEIKVNVERSPVLPFNELELKRQALVRQVHTSTSIEGNMLAEHQVSRLLSGKDVLGDDKSITEVKNYQEAVKEVERLSEKGTDLSVETIMQLHRILMKGLVEEAKLGHPRPGEIYIVDDLGEEGDFVRYKGPDADKIEALLQEMVEWHKFATKDELHPILKAGILHLQFIMIHPFADGNGRLARLLTQWSLYRDNWDFRKIIVLEEFYNRNRQDYYDAERFGSGDEYQEGQDMTPWIEYFVAGFLVEARKVKKVISALGFDRGSIKPQTFLDSDEVKIVDFLQTNFIVTSDQIAELLDIAKRTAQLKLKELADKGIIKMEGKGPSTIYVLATST